MTNQEVLEQLESIQEHLSYLAYHPQTEDDELVHLESEEYARVGAAKHELNSLLIRLREEWKA